jgi:hypothetical protein
MKRPTAPSVRDAVRQAVEQCGVPPERAGVVGDNVVRALAERGDLLPPLAAALALEPWATYVVEVDGPVSEPQASLCREAFARHGVNVLILGGARLTRQEPTDGHT